MIAALATAYLTKPVWRWSRGEPRQATTGAILCLGAEQRARAQMQRLLSPAADMPLRWLWAAMCQDMGFSEVRPDMRAELHSPLSGRTSFRAW